jgi:HlyD family secretion protein
MVRKALFLLAALMLLFAVYRVVIAHQEKEKVVPPVSPARTPFARAVAGAGIVEPRTENIAVGSYRSGIVDEVLVEVGEKVRQGQPLFRLEDRPLRAELAQAQANLDSALAQLARLYAEPRAEELPPLKARVREAQEHLEDLEGQYRRARAVYSRGGVSDEDLSTRLQAYRVAGAQLDRAKADLELKEQGAWAADIDVAVAAVEQAEAQVGQIETELERLTVPALMPKGVKEMEVLQVNVRRGEYVGTPPGETLILLGNVEELHVRVDIDEHDIPRFQPGRPARATLRGDPGTQFALSFVRVEPYVIPKKSLTGDNTERVDTRVLQVIYRLHDPGIPVYVGQQLDVFIEGKATPEKGGESGRVEGQ